MGVSARLLTALVVAGAAAFPAPAFAGAAFDPSYNPHASFREAASCPKCHPVVGGKPDARRLLPGSVDFCLGCHTREPLGRTHPIAMRPGDRYGKRKIPADLRLDSEGRVTCLACHRAHGPFLAAVQAYPGQKPENPDATARDLAYYRTRFARRSDPVRGFAVLCDGCHGKP